jgi:hypothetical protein
VGARAPVIYTSPSFRSRRPDARVFAQFSPRIPGTDPVYATFEPEVYQAQIEAFADLGVVAPRPLPPAPAGPSDPSLAALLTIQSLLSPDNFQAQYKYATTQVQAGQAYDYPIPPWCRHFVVTNRSSNPSGGTTSGNLYYWYDYPQQGAKALPQNYATLTAGQSISENSDFRVLTLFADATMTDQGWEIRFSGRPGDSVQAGPAAIIAPYAPNQVPTLAAPSGVSPASPGAPRPAFSISSPGLAGAPPAGPTTLPRNIATLAFEDEEEASDEE